MRTILLGNLGDVNFLEYGGKLVYQECPEPEPERSPLEAKLRAMGCGQWPEPESPGVPYMVVVEPPPEDSEGEGEWELWQLSLEKVEDPDQEWFGKATLASVASLVGTTVSELREAFASDRAMDRAWAYASVAALHGFGEFDGYSRKMSAHSVYTEFGLVEDCPCQDCNEDD